MASSLWPKSMPAATNYPATVADALIHHRRDGLPFELAWSNTMSAHPMPVEWHQGEEAELRRFLRAHMKAAYNRDGSDRGRFLVGEPDTSAAINNTRRLPTRWCRSADGCKHEAGFGRFGQFCAGHAEALAKVKLEAHDYNPSFKER